MPLQSADISGGAFGIRYTAVGQTWTIAAGVEVAGTEVGVESTFASSGLLNKGDLSGGNYGVAWIAGGEASTYSIINKAQGEIGGICGISVEDFLGTLQIRNEGDIHGSAYAIVKTGSGSVSLNNTGTIESDQYAVFIRAFQGDLGPRVENFGRIDGGLGGIIVFGSEGSIAKIVNHKGGVIKGGDAALTITRLDFTNAGKVAGQIFTGNADDAIVNKGKINGDAYLGAGVDTFSSKGGASAGLIDTGDGNDIVTLGAKADKLDFASTLDAATNVDTVRKFDASKDAIFLDHGVFSAIAPGTLSSAAFHKGTSAADSNDRIIYDIKKGALYYDPDGVDGVAQVQFAKFEGCPKLEALDFNDGDYSLLFA